jgi:hypothetical protein
MLFTSANRYATRFHKVPDRPRCGTVWAKVLIDAT